MARGKGGGQLSHANMGVFRVRGGLWTLMAVSNRVGAYLPTQPRFVVPTYWPHKQAWGSLRTCHLQGQVQSSLSLIVANSS